MPTGFYGLQYRVKIIYNTRRVVPVHVKYNTILYDLSLRVFYDRKEFKITYRINRVTYFLFLYIKCLNAKICDCNIIQGNFYLM